MKYVLLLAVILLNIFVYNLLVGKKLMEIGVGGNNNPKEVKRIMRRIKMRELRLRTTVRTLWILAVWLAAYYINGQYANFYLVYIGVGLLVVIAASLPLFRYSASLIITIDVFLILAIFILLVSFMTEDILLILKEKTGGFFS